MLIVIRLFKLILGTRYFYTYILKEEARGNKIKSGNDDILNIKNSINKTYFNNKIIT